MSNITDIYNAIVTQVATLFPNKRELSDSLIIDNNDELALEDGYGIYFGPATNTLRQIGCKFSIRRDIIITLTQSVRAGHKSITKIQTAEKALLENHFTLINDFSKNENIGAVVSKRDYISDTGLERVFGERRNFIMIESIFAIEYFEDFT